MSALKRPRVDGGKLVDDVIRQLETDVSVTSVTHTPGRSVGIEKVFVPPDCPPERKDLAFSYIAPKACMPQFAEYEWVTALLVCDGEYIMDMPNYVYALASKIDPDKVYAFFNVLQHDVEYHKADHAVLLFSLRPPPVYPAMLHTGYYIKSFLDDIEYRRGVECVTAVMEAMETKLVPVWNAVMRAAKMGSVEKMGNPHIYAMHTSDVNWSGCFRIEVVIPRPLRPTREELAAIDIARDAHDAAMRANRK